MIVKKQGLPEESELVLCTVSKVYPNSVFCEISEYGRQGMIHISEISPGRIRNIRDFVEEGRVIVCKVLKIDMEKGHIDLSLRRVSESQKRAKLLEVKQEQKAEKIIEFVASKVSMQLPELYKLVFDKVSSKYGTMTAFFDDVAAGIVTIDEFGIPKKIADILLEIVKQKIKIPEVKIGGILTISTYSEDGIGVIRKAFEPVAKDKSLSVKYLGAGKYKVDVVKEDYKSAEKMLKDSTDNIVKFIKQHDGNAEFVRAESAE